MDEGLKRRRMNKSIIQKLLPVISNNTVGKYDLPSMFCKPDITNEIITILAGPYRGKVDCVAAPEATGWLLGALVAKEINCAFVPIRKGNKSPYKADALLKNSYIDYSGTEKQLEIYENYPIKNNRVLIVDDWVETGASMRCCIKLMEQMQGIVTGLATVGIDECAETKDWIDTGFIVYIGKDI